MKSKEVHFKLITYWSILQNIIDRTVDIVYSCRVILETVYFIIYVLVLLNYFLQSLTIKIFEVYLLPGCILDSSSITLS